MSPAHATSTTRSFGVGCPSPGSPLPVHDDVQRLDATITTPARASAPATKSNDRCFELAREPGRRPHKKKARCGSRKGVPDGDASRLVMRDVAGDHGEPVHQRRRGDLLVERILGMRHAQPAPDLRDLFIERQDRVRVIACDCAEPTTKASRLREVASMVNCFNALAQLADRNRREEEGNALRRSIPKELDEEGVVRSGTLSAVLNDRRFTVGSGERVSLPRGSTHRWWNDGNETLVFEGYARPIVDLDRFLQAIFEVLNAGSAARPPLFYIAHLLLRHRHTQTLRIMPLPIQAVLFRVIVTVGTLLGRYRGEDWPGCPSRCLGAPLDAEGAAESAPAQSPENGSRIAIARV